MRLRSISVSDTTDYTLLLLQQKKYTNTVNITPNKITEKIIDKAKAAD